MAGKKDNKRELIDTGKDKRFVRRDEKGRFDEVADVGRSLSQDLRKEVKTKVPGTGRPRRSGTAKKLNRWRHRGQLIPTIDS